MAICCQIQMSSGNKILGYVQSQYINLNIYISSKIITEGLCGSYDQNRNNDLLHRFTRTPATLNGSILDVGTAASWRSVAYAFVTDSYSMGIKMWEISLK